MRPSIYLRHPTLNDQREFLAAVRASSALHHPWSAPPATPAKFRAYVERVALPEHCSFLICCKDTNRIAGVVNISNMIFGSFRSAYLGYYVFAAYERQGFMRAGLRAVISYAFKSLKLHRLEANIQPNNIASLALVESCGFLKEGLSPRYLKIAGRWRDHERWALLSS